MSVQSKYVVILGSGDMGIEVEKFLRRGADAEGKKFPIWVRETLLTRASALLGQPSPQIKK